MRINIRKQHHMLGCYRKYRHIVLSTVLCLLISVGCAQVPRQSVELSATVGRDIAQLHKAHRNLVLLHYKRIKNDINSFIDDVYAPYQIEKLLKADHDDFKGGSSESLFFALDNALKHPGDPKIQNDAFFSMEDMVTIIREEVETYRGILLAPVLKQESEYLSATDRSYNQVHHANSIVTGHLASIVKVHDAQEELLNEFGVEGLREEFGEKLSNTSKEVGRLVESAKKFEGTFNELGQKIGEIKAGFDALFPN